MSWLIIGDIYSTDTVSSYQPSVDVKSITAIVQKDYGYGNNILHKSWEELNNYSVITRMNLDQRTFNAYVNESIEDPQEAWKWRGTRSKARNKAIATHAQLTAGYIIPMFMAQNEHSEEDREMSDFMRDGIEWMVENSEYKTSFLAASMGMLVNPVTYLGAEYAEVFQTIKEKTDEGFTSKEILDEVLSGFRAPVYSADQILISNAYDQNIQRHRVLIKRRYIEWTEAKAKYGEHENWPHVHKGMRTVYSSDDGLFYDIKDEDHPFLVEEAIYLNRREDTEITYVSGIYMGDSDVKNNAMKHRDNRNAPKYNVVPFGYQRVNEHFYFYKSLMNSMYWDNMLIDAQYELGMNQAILETLMPIAITGADKVDSDIIFPGAVASFEDKDTKIVPLLPKSNLTGLWNAMTITEKSMSEGSISDQSAGQLPEAAQKATAVAIAERNAKTLMAGVGKTLAESIVQYGGLMADIFINNFSIPEIEEMAGDNSKLKYRTFILKNKVINGREVSKMLQFDERLLGLELTDEEIRLENLKLLKDIDFPNHKHHVFKVNPELFSRMKYLVNVEPERMFPKNEEFIQAMSVQLYQLLRNDPLIDPKELVRRVTYAFYRGESDNLVKKGSEQIMGQLGMNQGNADVNAQQPQSGRNAVSSTLATNSPTALTGVR